MAIKEKSRHQMAIDFRRLDHSDQWRSEGEWLPWRFVCPKIKRADTSIFVSRVLDSTIFLTHVKNADVALELGGFIDFVRHQFQVSRVTDRLDTPRQAWERYVELVRSIPEVQSVSVSEDSEGTTIWTIICTADFNKGLRSRVYRAQIDVLRASNSPMVNFRLLNLHDMPTDNRDNILPRSSKCVLGK